MDLVPPYARKKAKLSAGPWGQRLWWIALPAFLLVLFILVLLRPVGISDRSLPDFAAIEDVGERKEAFFTFLEPYVEEANGEIHGMRSRLERLQDHLQHGPLGRRESRWVREMATLYEIDLAEDASPGADVLKALLSRVDIIPPSLALSQAALESGWGTSRFARQGNNLFGMWCYEPGCGIVPKRRPAGATYEVKAYRSPRSSFSDYIQNLNTNGAYAPLRDIRRRLRASGQPVTGLALADGLYRYSQEGSTYIGKVKGMIRSNNLQRYDEQAL